MAFASVCHACVVAIENFLRHVSIKLNNNEWQFGLNNVSMGFIAEYQFNFIIFAQFTVCHIYYYTIKLR